MEDTRIAERCRYCGCIVHYWASPRQESLATPEQKRAFTREAVAAGNLRLYTERIAPYGTRTTWGIGFKCPGCGASGGTHVPEYAEDEAESVAAAQNQLSETAEAAREALNWKSKVRSRTEREARHFAGLLLSRFPEWKPLLRFVAPTEGTAREGDDLEWHCALVAEIPWPNAQVDAPLEARVLCAEVRLDWVGVWHTHVLRGSGEDTDLEHLSQTVELLETIVTEQVVIGVGYRDGNPGSSGCFPAGAELPAAWLAWDQPWSADQIVLRSWRGTYDREILRP